jgi:hypothetical protein
VLPAISVSAAPSSVRSGQSATYTVTTSIVNMTAPVTVTYTMSGKAVSGKQYVLSSSGQVTIPAGASSASVMLTAKKGSKKAKTAVMNLDAGAGYKVASPTTASVTIFK